MSWESTVPYYRIINEEVKARGWAGFIPRSCAGQRELSRD